MTRMRTSAGQTPHAPLQPSAEPTSRRADLRAAAAETVALVLAEDSPLPETDQDVQDLAARLRGHIGRLGVVVPASEPALVAAQRLGATPVPDGYVASRVYLCRLAKVVQELVAAAERAGVERPAAVVSARGRPWRPSRNAVRVVVFGFALIVLAIAACVTQT